MASSQAQVELEPPPAVPPSPSPRASRPSDLELDPGQRRRIPASASLSSISDIPLAPLPHHLAPFLEPGSTLSSADKRDLFTSTYLRSASSGNADTLEWLLSVPEDNPGSSSAAAAARRFSSSSLSSHSPSSSLSLSPGFEVLPDAAPRKWVNVDAVDDDGNTALGLCVALGHAEGVRVLVEGGASVDVGDKGTSIYFSPLLRGIRRWELPLGGGCA